MSMTCVEKLVKTGRLLSGIIALHDTILNVCIISNIDIIQNDGILDIAVVADVSFLKDHRIFYLTVHDTSAGDQAVFDACA